MTHCLVLQDKFRLNNRLYRLLDVRGNIATVIDTDDAHAFPTHFKFDVISALPIENAAPPTGRTPSEAAIAKAQRKFNALYPLAVELLSKVEDAEFRAARIREVAETGGTSTPTIYANLRKLWQGGMKVEALYRDTEKCGRPRLELHKVHRKKNGRSRSTALSGEAAPPGEAASSAMEDDTGYSTAVTTVSVRAPAHFLPLRGPQAKLILQYLEEHYLKRGGQSLVETHRRLLDDHFSRNGEDGFPVRLPPSKRPSYWQVGRLLKSVYTEDEIKKARRGDTDFAKNHRSRVRSVESVSLGPGEVYEIDAYRCDSEVTDDSRMYNAGRPILYMLKDRNTRLRVGMYIGFGEPCWTHIVLTILSVLEDKRELCERLGLPYRPEDWPAHGLLSARIVGDRGEMNSQMSVKIGELEISVTLLPGGRPDQKSVIETEFKLTKLFLQTLELGYTDDVKRSYLVTVAKKNAALTLAELEQRLWERLITENNKGMRAFRRTREEIRQKVRPTPIELWNYRFPKNPSFVSRHDAHATKMALLNTDQCSVTTMGFMFRGFYYASDALTDQGIFNKGKRSAKMTATFDPRSVDRIWVHTEKNGRLEVPLSKRCEAYAGLPFDVALELQRENLEMEKALNAENEKVEARGRALAAQLRANAKAAQKAAFREHGKPSLKEKSRSPKLVAAGIQARRNQEAIARENAQAAKAARTPTLPPVPPLTSTPASIAAGGNISPAPRAPSNRTNFESQLKAARK